MFSLLLVETSCHGNVETNPMPLPSISEDESPAPLLVAMEEVSLELISRGEGQGAATMGFTVIVTTSWGIYLMIDQSHKSHNAPVPYPTIQHFGTEMCTFPFQCSALWDMGHAQMGLTFYIWNKVRPRQNSHHFGHDIFKHILMNEKIVFWQRFHQSLFPRDRSTISPL